MNCPEWEEAIALYAGGDLEESRALAVERHLAGCAGCRIFSSGMLECLEGIRAGHRQAIAEAHFAAVRARVLSKLRPAPWWRRRWLRLAGAAVFAGCVIRLAMVERAIRGPVPPPRVALARPVAPLPVMSLRAHGIAPRRAVHPVRPKAALAQEPLTVRIVTDDPNVVIYWITNPRGE